MPVKIFALILLFAMLIPACSTYHGNKEITDKSLLQSKANETFKTKNDFLEYFGAPENTFYKDGKEVFEYMYVQTKGSYLFVFIYPSLYGSNHLWGPFYLGGIEKSQKYKVNHLFCYFDEDGNLVKMETVKVSGKFPPKKPKLK